MVEEVDIIHKTVTYTQKYWQELIKRAALTKDPKEKARLLKSMIGKRSNK